MGMNRPSGKAADGDNAQIKAQLSDVERQIADIEATLERLRQERAELAQASMQPSEAETAAAEADPESVAPETAREVPTPRQPGRALPPPASSAPPPSSRPTTSAPPIGAMPPPSGPPTHQMPQPWAPPVYPTQPQVPAPPKDDKPSTAPQTVLAVAGVVALSAGAIVFAAVTWTQLPRLLQLAILLLVAIGSGVGARPLERRAIRAGAGALVVVSVVFCWVVGWSLADQSFAVGTTVAAVAALVQCFGSTLVPTRILAIIAAAHVPMMWLGELVLDASQGWWNAPVWAIATIGAGMIAFVLAVLLRNETQAGVPATAYTIMSVWFIPAVVAVFVTAGTEEVAGIGVVLAAPLVVFMRLWAPKAQAGGHVIHGVGWLIAAIALAITVQNATALDAAVSVFIVTTVGLTLALFVERPMWRMAAGIAVSLSVIVRPDGYGPTMARFIENIGGFSGTTGLRVDEVAAVLTALVLGLAIRWLIPDRKTFAVDAVTIAALAGVILTTVGAPFGWASLVLGGALLVVTGLGVYMRPGTVSGFGALCLLLAVNVGGLVWISAFALVTAATILAVIRRPNNEHLVLVGIMPAIYAGVVVHYLLGVYEAQVPLAGPFAVTTLAATTAALSLAVRLGSKPAEIGAWVTLGFAGFIAFVNIVGTGLYWFGSAVAVAAIACAAAAALGDRDFAWWLSAAGATVAVWSWLIAGEMNVLEGYTLVPTVVLAAIGFVNLRRNEQARSWTSMGPALLVGLVPSTLLAFAVPGFLPRTLGVLAVGVVVAVIGLRTRLAALVVAGSLSVIMVALRQGWAAADLSPRWVTLTVVGVLLLVAAITYERGITRARQLGRSLARMR